MKIYCTTISLKETTKIKMIIIIGDATAAPKINDDIVT